jgi:hypothetical protein
VDREHSWRAAATLVTVLALWLPGGRAIAQDAVESSVAVVTLAGAQATLGQADIAADELLRGVSSDLPVILPARAREVLAAAGGQAALERARRTAEDARRELRAFQDLDRTATLLDGSIEAYLNALPLLEALDEPLRLLIDLATVELARDRGDRLRGVLDTAVRLDPALELDPREIPPRLVQASLEARERSRDVSVLPERLVRRICEALAVQGLVVVQPRPGPALVLVEWYLAGTGRRERSWLVEADEVRSVGVDLEALALTVSVGPAEGPPEVSDSAEAAPDEVVEPPDRPDDDPARTPWYRRWWVWTLIGAVVVGGAAVGTVFGVTSAQEPADLDLEVVDHW